MANPRNKRRNKPAQHKSASKKEALAKIEKASIPPASPAEMTRAAVYRSHEQLHIGPLPDPDTLERYNQIVPGAADAMINQFVAQSEHRRRMEDFVIRNNARRANWGLAAGFIVGIVGVAGSVWVMLYGNAIVGGLAFGTTLGSLVGTFIYGTRSQRQERIEKSQQNP